MIDVEAWVDHVCRVPLTCCSHRKGVLCLTYLTNQCSEVCYRGKGVFEVAVYCKDQGFLENFHCRADPLTELYLTKKSPIDGFSRMIN